MHTAVVLTPTMMRIISCSRRLQPTPPTMSTSCLLQCAIARSVISTSMAKMVSCTQQHQMQAQEPHHAMCRVKT